MTADPDWITVTIAASGLKKHVRRSRIDGFGFMLEWTPSAPRGAYIEMNGRAIPVKETEEQLAQLLGAA